jgi:hypothetical protein
LLSGGWETLSEDLAEAHQASSVSSRPATPNHCPLQPQLKTRTQLLHPQESLGAKKQNSSYTLNPIADVKDGLSALATASFPDDQIVADVQIIVIRDRHWNRLAD